METEQILEVFHPSFQGRIGVARRDITPPVGIYARMWGCAVHDTAEGIHRPLLATALSVQHVDGDEPLVLVVLDLGWWRDVDDEWFVRGPVLEALGLDPARLMIQVIHTHSGPATSLKAKDKPGGEKIEPYMRRVREAVIDAAREAIETAQPATLMWTTGRCDLAANRDLPNPHGSDVLCGFNPAEPADDTVLVGRVTGRAGEVLATIVNYACHPTTLGGANRLISPDYIGAMRETIEGATGGAPCLFLQGASGELGPRQGFQRDPAIADQNGRQLGYAALSALTGMLPNRKGLAFAGMEPSGAPLGRWEHTDHEPSTVLKAVQARVDLPLSELPSADQLAEQLKQCDDRVLAERLERAYHRRVLIGDNQSLAMPIWVWRLGDAFLIGTPAEAFSALQVELRRRFPDRAIAVMNLVGGSSSYLPTAEAYPTACYQVDVSVFQTGCLEKTLHACADAVQQLQPDRPARG